MKRGNQLTSSRRINQAWIHSIHSFTDFWERFCDPELVSSACLPPDISRPPTCFEHRDRLSPAIWGIEHAGSCCPSYHSPSFLRPFCSVWLLVRDAHGPPYVRTDEKSRVDPVRSSRTYRFARHMALELAGVALSSFRFLSLLAPVGIILPSRDAFEKKSWSMAAPPIKPILTPYQTRSGLFDWCGGRLGLNFICY